MGIISTRNQSVKHLKGLHLYHTDFCDCCDLVRTTLAMKHLSWVSHYLDVIQGDHLTAEFFRINPKGKVPVLVHNGVVIIESLDIVRYLERMFPDDSPQSSALQDEKLLWILAATAARQHIKVLSFEFLVRALPFHRENYVIRSKLHAQYGQTLGFYIDLGSRVRIDYSEIVDALQAVGRALQRLDNMLKNSPYLAGWQYSLADITWFVQVYRLKMLRLHDLQNYSQVMSWYDRMQAQPAVQEGMMAWQSRLLYDRFDAYLTQREKAGDDINASLWRGQATLLWAS